MAKSWGPWGSRKKPFFVWHQQRLGTWKNLERHGWAWHLFERWVSAALHPTLPAALTTVLSPFCTCLRLGLRLPAPPFTLDYWLRASPPALNLLWTGVPVV